ncbi:MAG: ABC transporter permease subunit [Planctomycetes bacterium]|nr:ABC transporter permease subunit [Planctomycetota bacterium]
MDRANVFLVLLKEMREARKNRWFLLFALIFAGLTTALSLVGLSGLGTFGIAGFGRTTASLLNLVLLVVPLMGLFMGAFSIAGEREQGTLLTLLAQPVVPEEILLGKFLGLAGALLGTILLGFGLAAAVIAYYGGAAQIGEFLILVACTFVFGLVFLSLGFCLSVLSRRTATAVGLALLVWLGALFLSDLGLIGASVALQLTPRGTLWLSIVNPAQVFKLLVIDALQGNLEALGPGGIYAMEVFGRGLRPLLLLFLALWIVVPLIFSHFAFRRRGGA